jgi:hypothetical protein
MTGFRVALAFACSACLLAFANVDAKTAQAVAPFGSSTPGWVEQKVTADDGAANANFGTTVALHGGLAAIGAYGADDYRGAVYLFQRSASGWTQAGKVSADDGLNGDQFGYRIALSDDLMVVGAFNATIGENTAQGSAYVFAPVDGTWMQAQKLTASDGGVFDNFGASTARDGDTLMVGANGATVNGNGAQGAVYVFTRSGDSWSEVQKLTADDGAMNNNFGIDIALDGDTVLIGAHVATIDGVVWAGAVYAFERTDGTWTQTQKLVSDSGTQFGVFGEKLARVGDTALIAAEGENAARGVVHVFTLANGNWSQSSTIGADDGSGGDMFGSALAFDGTRALIGADVSTIDGDTSRGSAYLFSSSDGAWQQTGKFVASDGATDNFFGSSVALEGNTVIVDSANAAIDGHAGQGAAYFYGKDGIFADGFDGGASRVP